MAKFKEFLDSVNESTITPIDDNMENDIPEVDLDSMTREELINLISDYDLNIEVSDGMSDAELRDEIEDVIDNDYDDDVEEIYNDDGIEEDDYNDDEMDESLVRKKIVRNGKVLIKKKSNKAGYKVKDGKEVRMSPQEMRKRAKAQKRASRKRKAKSSQASRKRKLSIKKRRF